MRKIKMFSMVVVFGTLITVAPVLAIEDSSNSGNTDQETTLQQTTVEDTATDNIAEGRADRLKAYQEKVTEKLTEAKSKRITQRCKSAQGKITSLRARVKNIVANRKKVYQEVGEKLGSLLLKFQAAGLDTTTLETAISDIKTNLVDLNSDMESYDTLLSDLEAMDCTADPDAFSNALINAREVQSQLRDKAKNFRSFTTTELKTIISELRAQLKQAKDTTNEQQVTDTSGDQ